MNAFSGAMTRDTSLSISAQDRDATQRWLLSVSITVSLCGLIVLVGSVASNVARTHNARASQPLIAFEMTHVEPTTPPVVAPIDAPPTPTTPRAAKLAARAPQTADEPAQEPTPALAQAAALITQDAPETLDFTDNAFVTGEGSQFAGGVTHRAGTTTQAVHGVAPIAQRGSVGAVASRARTITLDTSSLDCPGLRFASNDDVDTEQVVLRARVNANGDLIEIKVIERSATSIADDVIACAEHWRFNPALDDRGAPIAALSPPLRVRFKR